MKILFCNLQIDFDEGRSIWSSNKYIDRCRKKIEGFSFIGIRLPIIKNYNFKDYLRLKVTSESVDT